MIAFLALLGSLFIVVVGVEVLARFFRLPLELSRKATHILTGVAVAASAPAVPQLYRIILAVLFIIVIVVSKRRGIFRSIHDPNRTGIGDVWYPIGILLAAVMFPQPAVFTYAILILAVSDGFAGLTGKLFGRRKIGFIRTPKTYLGSVTFIVSAFIIGLLVPFPPFLALAAAIYLAVVELVSRRGIDNLILPVAAGVVALTFMVL